MVTLIANERRRLPVAVKYAMMRTRRSMVKVYRVNEKTQVDTLVENCSCVNSRTKWHSYKFQTISTNGSRITLTSVTR